MKKNVVKVVCLLGLMSCFAAQVNASHSEAVKSVSSVLQAQKITGFVKDSQGEPIIGANILVKGTANGTITDFNGAFTLNAPVNSTLEISYIGYLPQNVKATKGSMQIILKEDNKALDEVVVIGYGKMKKGDLSAAVGTLNDVGRLQERPVSSAAQMLQGQIPGVTVVANGGHPDSTPTITIRGMGSPNGESPLYVVDGVPNAPFNLSDVTSMTVLKDAASAAIYGAYAGSSGVILVTTKQAAAGKTSLEYNSVMGIASATNLPQSLTINQQRTVRAAGLGITEAQLMAQIPGWDPAKNPWIATDRTDWIDAVFRDAFFQRHNVVVSGGNDEFSNRASIEFNDNYGTLINTYKKKVIGRLNSMWKINKYIRVREDLSYQDYNSHSANTSSAESGIIVSALYMPRTSVVRYDNGNFGGTAPDDPAYAEQYGSNFANIHGDAINPVRTLEGYYNENHTSNLTSSTFLDIVEPIKGLNFTSRYTYKITNYFQRYFKPKRTESGKPNTTNSLDYSSTREPEWSWENTINYDRVFGRHNIGVMLSTTANEYTYRGFGASAKGFADESGSMMYFAQAGEFNNPWDGYSKDRNFSYVGRASYSFADRYFLTGSLRRDYAGRLPKNHKSGDFPSVTAAWKITSEPWFKKNEILNTLKVRASWGKIGNLGSISSGYCNPTLSSLAMTSSNDVGYQIGATNPIVMGTYQATAFNPLLTWETSEQLDLGLDATLFNNRLNFTVDYFNKTTNDLIQQQTSGWPVTIGISPMMINAGKVNNRGIEVSAGWTDKVGKLTYWVNGNMSTLRNRLVNIGDADENGEKPVWVHGNSYKNLQPYRSSEGKALYSYYLVPTDGVFMTDAEAAAYVDKDGNRIQPNAKAGDLKFVDTDGSGSIDSNDKVYMKNGMPKLTYAFNLGFTYSDFTFSMMLQGVTGVKLFNAYKYSVLNESLSSFNRSNKILEALNGPTYDVPRISATDPNKNFETESDWYLEDGSYLRIKNITVGYSLTNVLRKAKYFADRKSTLDVSLNAENLATFTNYSGIDPEVGGIGFDCGQYPVSRVFSLGLKLKF